MSARRAAVLGSPIAHSRSPQLHLAAYRALGLTDWTYERIECSAAELPSLVGGFGPEWVGRVGDDAGQVRGAGSSPTNAPPRAELVGSANTLVRTATGWRADNTDVDGVSGALGAAFGDRTDTGRPPSWVRVAPRPPPSSASPSSGSTTSSIVARNRGKAEPLLALGDAARRRRAMGRAGHAADRTSTSWSAPFRRTSPLRTSTPSRACRCCSTRSTIRGRPRWPTPSTAAGGRVISGLQMLLQPGVRPGRAVHRTPGAERGDERRAGPTLAFEDGGGGGPGVRLRVRAGLVRGAERLRRPAASAAQRADAARCRGCAGRRGAVGARRTGAGRRRRSLAALYLVVHLVAPAGMGAGDVKLAIGVGALTGAFGLDAWMLAAVAAPLLTALWAVGTAACADASAPCRTVRRCASPRPLRSRWLSFRPNVRSMPTRTATLDDLAAIADIYAHYVATSVATFELDPPDGERMASPLRRDRRGRAAVPGHRTRRRHRRLRVLRAVEDQACVPRDRRGLGVRRTVGRRPGLWHGTAA